MIDLSSSAAHGALADDVSRACDPSMDDALREHASALTQTIEVLLCLLYTSPSPRDRG